jgi:hypothetical protein
LSLSHAQLSFQLVCTTPSVPSDINAPIKVAIAAVDIDVYAVCQGDCTFYYRSYLTPSLTSYSLGAVLGQSFDMYGALRGLTAVLAFDIEDIISY